MKKTKRDKKYPRKIIQPGFRTSTLEEDLSVLLDDLCIEWGFCIPPAAADELSRKEKLSASEFAKGVLDAEGLHSSTSPWFKKIEQRFVDRFGDHTDSGTDSSK